MDWIRWNDKSESAGQTRIEMSTGRKISVEFVEDRDQPSTAITYGPVSTAIPDDQLPFVSPSVVKQSIDLGLLWIVIGDIIYDCTEFVKEHPGGQVPIKSFKGADCTWQFYRFHGRDVLDVYGKALRVGRTQGIKNVFTDRPAWVGLRRLGVE